MDSICLYIVNYSYVVADIMILCKQLNVGFDMIYTWGVYIYILLLLIQTNVVVDSIPTKISLKAKAGAVPDGSGHPDLFP